MKVTAIKTERVVPYASLDLLLDSALTHVQEKSIICITSKIISLCEGAIVRKADAPDKRALVRQEADAYLPDQENNPYNIFLTIKNSILIPTAGIDESNGEDIYILYPRDIQKSAYDLWRKIREKHNIQELGILITDSTTTPMRRGVTGVGLGWCGFKPLYNYVGKPDCFGNPLRVTLVNNLDALAAASVFVMGEGNEQTPLAVMTDVPKIEFQDRAPTAEEVAEVTISLESDLYAPVLMAAPWIKNDVR